MSSRFGHTAPGLSYTGTSRYDRATATPPLLFRIAGNTPVATPL